MLATTVTETTETILSLESSLRKHQNQLLVTLGPALQEYFSHRVRMSNDSEERRDYAVLMNASVFAVENDGIVFSAQRLGQTLSHKVMFSSLISA